MATAAVARPAAKPQPRARDEEVLVWPDLVFIEFIAAMVFTLALFLLSFLMNAPLLDQANADVTPNP
ncbi:MAG: menaquinol-cytochrome C reductase, partial [Chloroflexi bacterium CFX7]|nr:menaquinol-cytochrome C reductase [Chloroflexi bacterium CFX7]